MNLLNQENLIEWRILGKTVNWQIERNRVGLLRELTKIFCKWKGEHPDLRYIFQRDELDWLISKAITEQKSDKEKHAGEIFIDFLIKSGYKHKPKVDKNGKPLLERTTAVHHAVRRRFSGWDTVIRKLFVIYDRFDVNYVDELGLTHFHAACICGTDRNVKKFLANGQDPDCLVPDTHNSPLHLALFERHKHVIVRLLHAGANPNLANKNGSTPLHIICKFDYDAIDLLDLFLSTCRENYRKMMFDVQDKLGDTPLHHALKNRHEKLVKQLLLHGADPNVANKQKWTPLHLICSMCQDSLMRLFFKINDQVGNVVNINAVNKKGYTPLHLSLGFGEKKMVEFLLRRRADPNLASRRRWSPLHTICLGDNSDEMAQLFFELNDELKQRVNVNVKDRWDRTPLEWTVAYLNPDVLDLLLDRGADLSEFVFPLRSYYGKLAMRWPAETGLNMKLANASSALMVVERLRKRGYVLDRSDALTIMKFFNDCGMVEKRPNFKKIWFNDEKFVEVARTIRIGKLSLYDLIDLSPAKATKVLTYSDYRDFAREKNWLDLPEKSIGDCDMHLCEKMAREFFRRWALDPFADLSRDQLSEKYRKSIMAELDNKDLYMICLSSKDSIFDKNYIHIREK